MNVIDLTHFISDAMPVFPGTEPPQVADAFTIDRHGFAEKSLRLLSHTGTHVDAPGHLLAGGPWLDTFSAGQFLGPGLVLDVSAVCGRPIEIKDIRHHEAQLKRVEFTLLHSGWAKHWGSAEYFAGYPVLSPDAAEWLARFDLKGIGVDMISVDEVDSTALAVHKAFLARNLLVVENLANLDMLIGKEFTFSCLPLKIAGADGSPVRAVAIIDRDT